MERRKFVIGLGSLAAGSAAAMGSSAFTAGRADRDVSVTLASDANAYIGLEKGDSNNADAFVSDSGTLAINFADTDAGGEGIADNSAYAFDNLFRLTNQGTSTAWFALSEFGPGIEFVFYVQLDDRIKLVGGVSTVGSSSQYVSDKGGGIANAVKLDPGQSVNIGVEIHGPTSAPDPISIYAADNIADLESQWANSIGDPDSGGVQVIDP